ncbi:unnamed protein product [Urochloa decumbens]|uniref:F-box domain-containing protein n=1 Tax=Urochloa decumbens TaxID=240449 RepID=A0ABC8W5T1_9POAL
MSSIDPRAGPYNSTPSVGPRRDRIATGTQPASQVFRGHAPMATHEEPPSTAPRSSGLPNPPPPLPWLAFPDGTLFSFPGSSAFKFPGAANYHSSCDDWLVFERDGGYLLRNPFTGDTMRLPSVSCVRYVVNNGGRPGSVALGSTQDERAPRDATLRKMVMCPGHQLVVAIVGDQWRDKVAVCRPGGDRWFVSAHDPWRVLRDIAFYDGKVYAVDDLGRLYARAVGGGGVECACTGESMALITGPAPRCHTPSTRYLVVSGGKLLMVHRVLRGHATSEFKVFRFTADLAASRWVEAPSGVGGDTALFVGQWSSVVRRVSRRHGMPGNMIYFLDDEAFSSHFGAFSGDHFGAYDTRDGKTYPLLPPRELHNDSSTPATWLFPREEEGASWRDLPLDVLGQVMRLLPSRDARLDLALVCHNWRASVRRHQRRHPPAVAHLALPTGMIFRYPELKSHLFSDCAFFRGAACDDWLVFDDGDGVLRLTSPFTGRTRLLPSLSDGIHTYREPIEIENEPAPSDDGPTEWRSTSAMTVQKLIVSPDGGGLIAAVVGSEYFGKVALCSLDTFAWSLSAHDRWRWYEDMAFDDDGKVYALTGDEDLLAFDAGVDAYTGNAVVARVTRVIQSRLPREDDTAKARYLVRSLGGALLLVRRHFLADETTVWFSVFRADLGSSPPRWEEVDDLGGGEALFVGRHCSRAVRARGAVRGDQIFFLQDERVALLDESWRSRFRHRPGYHAGVYDMRERMITEILPQRMKCDGPSPTTWLFRDADGLDDGDQDHIE